jgi:two-component system, OmpR family, phosphate regulon response regulator PhoB
MRGRLLLVEDDPHLVQLLQWRFEREEFDVTHTPDGDQALQLAKASPPDIVLLDWMIEGPSGLEVCRRLRRCPETAAVPIIMVTARGEEADRIRGLEAGADDYVAKPFSPGELVARVGAVMRRARPALAGEQLAFGDLTMDLAAHKVRRSGQLIPLAPTEFRLLRHLLENPERVFSRERLLEAIWPRSRDIDVRTIDVHIRRLRTALNGDGRKDLIRTVRAAGYALDDGN